MLTFTNNRGVGCGGAMRLDDFTRRPDKICTTSPKYKFYNSKDEDYIFKHETIKLTLQRFFREQYYKMEMPDSTINDPNEGRILLSHQPIMGQLNKADSDGFTRMGMSLPPGTPGLFSGNTAKIGCRTNYIYSLCDGPIADRKNVFCEPPMNYDRCIRIDNPAEMLQYVRIHASYDSQSFEDIFWSIETGYVNYNPIEVNMKDNINFDGFYKDKKLNNQAEWRAVFGLNYDKIRKFFYFSKELKDFYILHVPGISKFYERIDL